MTSVAETPHPVDTFLEPERAATRRAGIDGLGSPRPLAGELPSLFQQDEFCVRFSQGLDEVVAPVYATLDCFDAYLDPQLAPEDFVDWLAGWVGVEVDETWPVARRRQLIERMVSLYRIRGTAEGLAAHVALYSGVTPEVVESGGCGWSEQAGAPLPGSARASLTVRVRVADAAGVNRATLERIVAASRPAHVPFVVEVITADGQPVPSSDGDPPGGGDGAGGEGAPGAFDLPGSAKVELSAAESPPTDPDGGAPPAATGEGLEAE